ncbi:hypothetical protein K2173_026133 [Erythroxylum novogranatense]|uniref:Mechanosensitive ion channel protein n=1 Tax=Erythroxylum novogranatense TaxID=1862640 RepID=A0AAV8TYH6_9ROSI|nr:hypothetical protein K2173_026133 [Erythroxylum novogranatense]
MDGKEGTKNSEISMGKRTNNLGDIVIAISHEGTAKACGDKKPANGAAENDQESFSPSQSKPSSPRKELNSAGLSKSCYSMEISGFSPSPNKSPNVHSTSENLIIRPLARSIYSKPKSRFGEPPIAVAETKLEDSSLNLQQRIAGNSPHNRSASSLRINSITSKTPLMQSPGGTADDENEEEMYKTIELSSARRSRVRTKVVIQWVSFVCILCCLVTSLTIEKFEKIMIWGLEFWRWCVLVLVIFCGLLVTNWFMHFVVFFIERNFLLRKKVLYFVYGLKKSVQVFIWIGLVLLAWIFVFDSAEERSKTANTILHYITWTLVSLLIGSFLWLLKTLLLKILASSFHVRTFFDRIQESIFHQYVLQILSGPALIEEAERVGRTPSAGQLSFRSTKKDKGVKETKMIDMGKFHYMKREKVSAWTMKILIDAVRNSGLSTISNTLDESVDDGSEQSDNKITNEIEATAAAFRIFRNVAHHNCNYLEEEDLSRFMIKEEVNLVFPLFKGSETGRIDIKALTDWVVKVYNDRKALAHALNDTKTAVKQLNKLVTGILFIVTIVIWLLLVEIATTKVILFLSSQLVVAAFMFGNTCKTIFEAIIFVFVMHPFDVGDRCVVEGVPLLVEEMNILTTVFLKLDNEKVYYPNSVLATKPISNYYRSSNMGDTIEFSIDFATSVEKIGLLKEGIKKCLEKNSHHWHPNHNVVVKEIENVNKLKMALYCNHTMNFQQYAEKNKRRTELVLEIKKIFEDLSIKYYPLPQEVHLSHMQSDPKI